MKSTDNIERFALLYIPWILSVFVAGSPVLSYFIAWLGSFFIFFLTLTGKVRPLPEDRSFAEQLMRPFFIVQIIFAGYMCCTSVFYFLAVLGYENFQRTLVRPMIDMGLLERTAQCQRYYCFAHASFVSGILFFMRYPIKSKYHVQPGKLANLLLMIAIISFPVSVLFNYLPGLSQFYYQFSSLSFIAGTLALAFAIPLKKTSNTIVCSLLYCFNFYQAFLSGFKEPIIISVLVLGIFLYPNYKKLVTIIFVPAMFLLFVFLPSYVNSFRANAWSAEGESSKAASQIALDAALNNDDSKDDTNWGFLVFRLSEIDMFTRYIQSTPKYVPYYGIILLEQSAIAIVPRVLWPSKPITEALIMERVYAAGVVNRASNVSAKPAFVVDAYLSDGYLGIFISLFLYGAIAQAISIRAEQLFGGYILGTALIFSGLFQIFWRGLSFEFIINSVFWSYVSMLIIFKILRSRNILEEVD